MSKSWHKPPVVPAPCTTLHGMNAAQAVNDVTTRELQRIKAKTERLTPAPAADVRKPMWTAT